MLWGSLRNSLKSFGLNGIIKKGIDFIIEDILYVLDEQKKINEKIFVIFKWILKS